MKILVIGCGSIGQRHAKNARDFADEVGIYDMNLDLMRTLALSLGLVHFSDLKDALSWQPDGVIISTPHKTHIDIAKQATKYVQHILIEKPISNTLKGLDVFLANAEQGDCNIYVVCNMRFHPAVLALSKNMNRIGKVMFARSHYGNYLPNMRPDADYQKLYCAHKSEGGGVVLDAIHEVDYLFWLFGEISNLWCEKAKRSELEIDVEDYAALVVRHDNGIRSEVHLDYLQRFKRRGCEIIGSAGTLIWQSEGKSPENCSVRLFDAVKNEWETVFEDQNLDANVMYKSLMQEFMDVIKIKMPAPSSNLLSGRDAAKSLAILLEARDA